MLTAKWIQIHVQTRSLWSNAAKTSAALNEKSNGNNRIPVSVSVTSIILLGRVAHTKPEPNIVLTSRVEQTFCRLQLHSLMNKGIMGNDPFRYALKCAVFIN